MIIENGKIEFKVKKSFGFDPETGYPVEAEASWGKPIPCQFIPNTGNNLGKVDGVRFTTASHTILIEIQPLPQSEQIRLTDSISGECLGEFSLIMKPEIFRAVGQIRLLI